MKEAPNSWFFPQNQTTGSERWIVDVLNDLEMFCRHYGLEKSQAAISRAVAVANQELFSDVEDMRSHD